MKPKTKQEKKNFKSKERENNDIYIQLTFTEHQIPMSVVFRIQIVF